jgi:hypothetical protein
MQGGEVRRWAGEQGGADSQQASQEQVIRMLEQIQIDNNLHAQGLDEGFQPCLSCLLSSPHLFVYNQGHFFQCIKTFSCVEALFDPYKIQRQMLLTRCLRK